ncbi:hypothetical protein PRIC2_003177 [Phytophthora ramorum]
METAETGVEAKMLVSPIAKSHLAWRNAGTTLVGDCTRNAATGSSALSHSRARGGRRLRIESKNAIAAMFKALFRCIRRIFGRMKPKNKVQLPRRTEYGADIDIEEALAVQMEIQRRSGRVLSSTASIAAALRQRPREDIPAFSTQLGNDEHREPSDPAIQAAVEEMQSLTPGYIGQTGENPATLVDAKSPVVSKRVASSRASSSRGSSIKIPESVPEDEEPEEESESKDKSPPAVERPSEMNIRRSSIFDMRPVGEAGREERAWHDVCLTFACVSASEKEVPARVGPQRVSMPHVSAAGHDQEQQPAARNDVPPRASRAWRAANSVDP